MKKIFILYATAGMGHAKAAFAVKEAFDKSGYKNVISADVLDYTSKFFKISYCSIYIFLVKYLPTVWGIAYYLLDNPIIYKIISPLRRFTNKINRCKVLFFC